MSGQIAPERSSKAVRLLQYVFILLFIAGFAAVPSTTFATPNLNFPFPCGQTWKISRGYYDDSIPHPDDPWNKFALDFIHVDGETSGQPVLAVSKGIARLGEDPNRGGHLVKIDHGGGYESWYAHLQENARRAGQVDPGDVIGYADSSGVVIGGPHIHFAFFLNGVPVRPEPMSGYPTSNRPFRVNQSFISDNCKSPPRLTLILGSARGNRSIEVELFESTIYKSAFKQTAISLPDGNILLQLVGVTPGIYTLFVKPKGYLRKKISNLIISSNSNEQNLQDSLCAGDTNNDNKVNVFDLGRLVGHYNQSDPDSDFNGDGVVNVFDLGMLSACYGAQGDTSPQNATSIVQNITNESTSQGQLALNLVPASGQALSSSPADNIFQVGNIFRLSVDFDTSGQMMQGADVVVDYDPCVLELLGSGVNANGGFSKTDTFLRTGTFEYAGHKWNSTENPSPPVSGSGNLASLSFKVKAGIPGSTNVAIRFKPGDTAASNMSVDGTNQAFLGQVTNFVLSPRGTPQRPSQSVQVTYPPASKAINQNALLLQARVNDTCNGIRKMTFFAFTSNDNQWHEIGTDFDGSDGWQFYWDTSQLTDQVIKVKGFASDMAGNGVESPVNANILLDRQPPSVTNLTFNPSQAVVGQPVTIRVNLVDQLSGIKQADVYVDPATDDSAPEHSWNLVGSVYGSTGSVIWDTALYTPGSHKIVLVLEDRAGNETVWPLPGESAISYLLTSVGETLVVPFNRGPAGTQTARTYAGPTAITISGVGQASSTQMSDAFYLYTDRGGGPITPVHPNMAYWTLWINGGPSDIFVQPIPPYNPNHVYTFTINAPGSRLTFGVGDTATGDNTGAYTITVRGTADTIGTIFLPMMR